jgi:hypothetical protein
MAAGILGLTMTANGQPGIPIVGSFSISAEASPNTKGAAFCGGPGTDQAVIEGHGTGSTTLGAFTFDLNKTLNFATGLYTGCVVLTNLDGDTVTANYKLQQVSGTPSDFSKATGTLTFTGGTGRLKGAKGSAKIIGVFLNLYPGNSFLGGGTGPLQVAAQYIVEGTITFAGPLDH